MKKLTIISALTIDNKKLSPLLSVVLKECDKLIVESSDKELMHQLSEAGVPYESFSEDLKEAEKLLERTQSQAVLYGIEGHPLLENGTLRRLAKEHEQVEIILPESPEQSVLSYLKEQPVKSSQFLPASQVNSDTIQTGQHVVISRLSEEEKMSQVTDSLLLKYPADYEVALLKKAQRSAYHLRWLSLEELKQRPADEVDSLTVIYCPPLKRDQQVKSFSTLQSYIDEVTGVNGDVWIREQSASSLIKYVREETEELIEAIEKEDTENWKEELGDVLVQILYQSSVAEREQHFTFEDVLEEINRKIRRRHPHVFDGVKATTPEEVDALWQKIKLEEKRQKK